MLPTLVSQDLGGTLGTDVIGAYLRSVGAEALIYPSARCNVEVEIRDKQLAGFHGWNLVDYRDAAIDSLPDLPAFSLTAIDQGIGIEAPPAGNDMFYGSWRMKGSSERAVRRFEAEVKSYFNASPA